MTAQRSIYPQALAELARGREMSHWRWFVFPRLAGLGRGDMARRCAIVRSGQREWTGQGGYEGPSCGMCSPAA
nr:DUF1810 family protein [Melittangium boletus]